MSPLILLGPPGAGKSTAGKRAAEALGRPFVDLDQIVEAEAGMDIDALWAREGEARFRAREVLALSSALGRNDAIIAAGAGVVDSSRARALLSRARCVLLDVDPDVALARLAAVKRPWLTGTPEERRALYEAREAPRREGRHALATVVVDANRPAEDVARALVEVAADEPR